MCKNADNPCPGCTRHKPVDAPWMFFTDEEREAAKASNKMPALADGLR